MTTMTGRYLGGKRMALTHEGSGVTIQTAAPLDNNGDGSSFSPTDLVASALGACMCTVMGIYADRHQIDLAGSYFIAKKIMADSPRRIQAIPLELHLPRILTQEQRTVLERVARTCPVHQSLRADIEAEPTFLYDV